MSSLLPIYSIKRKSSTRGGSGLQPVSGRWDRHGSFWVDSFSSCPFVLGTIMARQSTTPMEIKIAPELINQYRAEEITLQRLADLHSVSVTTIWRELKRHGICRGSRRGRPASHQKRAAVLALAERGFSRQQI